MGNPLVRFCEGPRKTEGMAKTWDTAWKYAATVEELYGLKPRWASVYSTIKL
jgi:hypothetical protein